MERMDETGMRQRGPNSITIIPFEKITSSEEARNSAVAPANWSDSSASSQRDAQTTSQKAQSTVEQAAQEIKRTLLHWNELPDWARDNAYISSGYRPHSPSIFHSLSTLTYLHNESVNIFSHLLACIFFALRGIAFIAAWFGFEVSFPLASQADASIDRYKSLTGPDVLSHECFFLGAVACLGLSATFHTILNHAEQSVVRFWLRADYLGIALLTWGSFVASVRYGFVGHEGIGWAYIGMITFISSLCIYISLDHKFATADYRSFRASMFVAMGLSGVLPLLHGVFLLGLQELQRRFSVDLLLLEGGLYILGAGLYAARVPERFRPGKHDIWGSSHQIFHVLVVLAAYTHYICLERALVYSHGLHNAQRA